MNKQEYLKQNKTKIIEILKKEKIESKEIDSILEAILDCIEENNFEITDEELVAIVRPESKKIEIKEEIPLSDSYNQYINEIKRIPLLSPVEEKRLFKSYKNGDKEAKRILIESNLRLVISIASKFHSDNMTLLDLVGEGNLGLLKAVEKFNIEKGYKFSTYATWWIKQSILRALHNKSKMIRIPEYAIEAVRHLNIITEELKAKLLREPTDEELAKKMNMSVYKILELKAINQDPMSLDAKIGEDDSMLGDFIEDTNSLNPEYYSLQDALKLNIEKILLTLARREKQVICMHYGIGQNPKTLTEIGQILGVTKERVRQVERDALRKLRHPRNNQKIKDFIK